tara:strand:- start:1163 stop:1420 length:258 start_codon:yes stop_codon:yes gene_type:complete
MNLTEIKMNALCTKLTVRLRESLKYRDDAVQTWRRFVLEYCSFEDGMPSNPAALPPIENEQLTGSMTYWNKQVARDTVNLEKAMK